jgi:hypothetical protein
MRLSPCYFFDEQERPPAPREPRRASRPSRFSRVECFHEHRFGLRDSHSHSLLQRQLSYSWTKPEYFHDNENIFPSGPGGNRTHRLPGKNRLLDLRATDPFRPHDRVGRTGIEPAPCRLKVCHSTLELTSLTFLFWPASSGHGLRFHRRLLSSSWWGTVESNHLP